MSEIDFKFSSLRVKLRQNGIGIIEDIKNTYYSEPVKPLKTCVFCRSSSNITKEHVIPKWLFEKKSKTKFISSVNHQAQTYNNSVIPTCDICNNSILAHIEAHTIETIRRLANSKDYYYEDLSDIIRWLEILDYKLQVFDCCRKYIKDGNSAFDPNWGVLPLAVMRHFYEFKPYRAYDYLRSSQIRIIVKAKLDRTNSLVVLSSKVPHFNFFVLPHEYIFVSVPIGNIAFFYFLRKEFDHHREAEKEAVDLVVKVLAS